MASSDTVYRNTQGRRRILVFAGLAVVIITIVVVLVWSFQRSLIYFPDTSEVPPAAEALAGGQDVTLQTSDGLELGAWFAPAAEVDDRDVAVLMAPGNGGNRENRIELAEHFQHQGFAVLLMDYRGYSTNPGTPTEAGLIRDGHAAVDALETLGYPPEQTIYFGESIGGGVLAALLSEHDPGAAVFRSPFTELADVGRHHYPWLPVRTILRDTFPVTDHVRQTQVPITVIRADEDSVIPAELSAQVAAEAPNLVEEYVIEGADHNDPIMFGSEIAEAVSRTADAIAD